MKRCFFLFCVFLQGFSWALVKDAFQSLNNALDEPYRYWYLNVSDGKIIKTNLFGRVFYKTVSFISENHKQKLRMALISSIKEIQNRPLSFDEDYQKIILEKVCSLLSQNDDNLWFGNLNDHFHICRQKIWSFAKNKRKIDQNVMYPVQKDGYFYNNEYESLVYLNFNEVKIYVNSLFSSSSKINLNELRREDPILARTDDLNIQWLGHSTFLIQVDDLNILIDPTTEAFHPLFGSLVKCFRRYTEPGISLKKLPKIDLLLISHNHFDHMEDRSLLYLKRYQPQIFIPEGLNRYFANLGYKAIQDFLWWDSSSVSLGPKKLTIYAMPARHNSMSRSGIDRQKSLWCGWVIQTSKGNIYFAGDTAYDKEMFKQIKKKFGQIDVAILPIAPEKMRDRHMDHHQALKALKVLDSKMMLPMHWGAYRTGDEKIEEPYLFMLKAMDDDPKLGKKIKLLKIGERITFKSR